MYRIILPVSRYAALTVFGMFILLQTLHVEHSAAAETPNVESIVDMLRKQGNLDSASAVIQSALVTDSTNIDLLMSLADIQKIKRQPKARRGTLERILKIRRRSVDARLALAEDFFAARQLDSAGYFASAALTASNRRSAEAYYWVGRVHHEAGRADSAVAYYRGAIKLLPSGDLF